MRTGYLKTGISLSILGLVACTPVKLIMKVDPVFERRAVVYKLDYPDSLTDKISGNQLNVSFGPYRVSDVDASWTEIKSRAEEPEPIFRIKERRKSGNATTTTTIGAGPTEILGFSRPAAEGEPSINESFRTISYKFVVDKEGSWNAKCTHQAEKRVTKHENRTIVERLTSNFSCHYSKEKIGADSNARDEVWILSIDLDGTITMNPKGKSNTLIAHSAGGFFVRPDKTPTKNTSRYVGYTWHQNKNSMEQIVAAISVREEVPRVWLDKDNSNTMNVILAMASTGLLIYGWEINQ